MGPRETGKLTIRTMLLHYLHGADDARLLAIRLVEEGEIPLLHGAQIVPSYIVSYSWWWLIRKIPLKIKPTFFFRSLTIPRLRLRLGRQVVNGKLDVDPVLDARFRLCLEQPVRLSGAGATIDCLVRLGRLLRSRLGLGLC